MNHKTVIGLLSVILATIVILGIILVSVFSQSISELKNIIMNSESTLLSQLSNINVQVDSMTYDIQTMLDKQNSLITGYNISYSNPNAQTLKCDVSVTVTPKEYSEDTTADLYIGETRVPMTRSGNAYVATKTISLTEVSEASVTFQQSDTNQTEILPETIGIGYSVKNSLKAEPMFDWSFQDNTISMVGDVEMTFISDFNDIAESARFVALKHGKEIWSEDIKEDDLQLILYSDLIWIDHTFENVENEETISIYAEVVGSSGLTYRKTIWGSKETDVDGVYDANGNLIEFSEYTEF